MTRLWYYAARAWHGRSRDSGDHWVVALQPLRLSLLSLTPNAPAWIDGGKQRSRAFFRLISYVAQRMAVCGAERGHLGIVLRFRSCGPSDHLPLHLAPPPLLES